MEAASIKGACTVPYFSCPSYSFGEMKPSDVLDCYCDCINLSSEIIQAMKWKKQTREGDEDLMALSVRVGISKR